jgi:hypothetical protein
MKKKIISLYGLSLAVLLSAVLLTNCKKDTPAPEPEPTPAPTPPPPPTNTEKLTGKNFKLTALTVNPGLNVSGTVITDLYTNLMEACEKDNLLSFTADGKYKEDEAGSKCDPTDPQVVTGTWSFNSTESIVTLKADGATLADNLNIVTNDGTTLKFTSEATDPNTSIKYVFTYTYTKQ